MKKFIEIKTIPLREAIQILKKDGIDVDEEEAKQIMDFLNNISRLIIKECFDDEE